MDFEATRVSLLERVGGRLLAPDGAVVSLRELAAAADVSTATLRHYFEDRESLITAYLEHCYRQGTVYLLLVASHPLQEDAATSLRWALDLIRVGLENSPLSRMHVLGMQAGMGSPVLGPAYLNNLLEPTLRCVEVRIERHQGRGELVGRDARVIALQLVAPLLLAVLHQGPLCGDRVRPLDTAALVEALVIGLDH